MVECCELVTKLFESGKLKPLEVTDLGGLDTIQKGMDMLQSESREERGLSWVQGGQALTFPFFLQIPRTRLSLCTPSPLHKSALRCPTKIND